MGTPAAVIGVIIFLTHLVKNLWQWRRDSEIIEQRKRMRK